MLHRFNEEIETASQRSVNRRRAISRGAASQYNQHNNSNFQTIKQEEDKKDFK